MKELFVRSFNYISWLVQYVNDNQIAQADIQLIDNDRPVTPVWFLVFWWDCSTRFPIVKPATQTGTGVITTSGISTVEGTITLIIVSGGATGTATFKYKLNDGAWSEEITTDTTVALPNTGINLHFSGSDNTAFASGDTFVIRVQIGNIPPPSPGRNL